MGVNPLQTGEELNRLNLVYATSLFLATRKNILLFDAATAILCEFEPLCEKFVKSGFPALQDLYSKKRVTLG